MKGKEARDVYALRADTIDFHCLVVFAARYAIGRRTYAPSTVCDVLFKALPDLQDGTIDCLLRDLADKQREAAFDPKVWGDEHDRSCWYRLWEHLATEKKRRENARRMKQ